MKTFAFAACVLCTVHFAFGQNVGIGTNAPHSSAQLDVSSTTRGFLAPRTTTAQRNAIASPAKGLLVYDTDLNALYHYNGAAWAAVGGGGGGFSLPYEATVNLNASAFKITNSGFGAAIQAVTTNEFGYALQATNTTNYGYSVFAYSRSPNGIGVYASVDSSIAIKGASTNGIAIDAISTDSTALRARIIKGANTDPVILATHAGGGIALDASSSTGMAVRGASGNPSTGLGAVTGLNTSAAGGVGVYGGAASATGIGVRGEANTGVGVLAYSGSNVAVSAGTLSGTALLGNSISGYALETSGKVKISGGNTNPAAGAVLTSLDASGNAVWAQPSVATPKVGFRAFGVSSFQTAGTPNNEMPHNTFKKIEFQTESYDTNGEFTTTGSSTATSTTSTFSAPIRGVYHFDGTVKSTDNLLFNHYLHELQLRLNRGGSVSTIGNVETTPNSLDGSTIHISMDVFLEADDIVWLEFKHVNLSFTGITLETSGAKAFFSGHLIYTQ
jgi:hypothetical protein